MDHQRARKYSYKTSALTNMQKKKMLNQHEGSFESAVELLYMESCYPVIPVTLQFN